MRYENFEFLWPPRPEKAIPKALLGFYEKKGWVAQAKANGTCNVIAVSPDRTLVCMNRHNETHKLWHPTAASSEAFKRLVGDGWFVFVGELLHSKVAADKGGVRDTNYLHDVLVADGEHLVGKSYRERHSLLCSLFLRGDAPETKTHFKASEKTWIAKIVERDFTDFYASLETAEDEGLVIKDPNASLAFCGKQTANGHWQVKCRKATKNYGF